MARPEAPPRRQVSLVAAATTYPGLSQNRAQPRTQEGWQTEVWEHFDTVPEFQFGLTWLANVCSRAVIRPMVTSLDPETGLEVKTVAPAGHPAWALLDELTGGRARQSEFIRLNALHFGAVGEAYLVNRAVIPELDGANTPSSGFLWEIVGTNEIRHDGQQWWLLYEEHQPIPLTADNTVIRMWVPHPARRSRAFASSKSLRGTLREIRRFDAHIEAQADSRLTGSGMVFVPDTMKIKPPAGTNPSLTAADLVSLELAKTMEASKTGQGTAVAQVPIFVTADRESIKAVKHLQFWSKLDENAQQMRQGSIGRMATGMDVPKEVITGTGDMNRWGAWQVEESSVKATIEPRLGDIVGAWTTEYLHVVTGDTSVTYEFDTSALRLRPNRSKEAVELYDRGELNGQALRRETGFSEDDKPTKEEREVWMLLRMSTASWAPAQAQAAAERLGVKLGIPIPEDNAPREARPTPSLEDHPVRDRPKISVVDDVAATAGALLVFRAMERAGNRLRTVTNQRPDCAREQTHTVITAYADKVDDLLKGSFDCAATFGLDDAMSRRAQAYAATLLIHQEPFDHAAAVRALRGE